MSSCCLHIIQFGTSVGLSFIGGVCWMDGWVGGSCLSVVGTILLKGGGCLDLTDLM